MLDATHDGILVVDGDGRLEFANQSCHRLLGRNQDPLIGKPLRAVLPADAQAVFDRFWASVADAPQPHLTLELTGTDGVRRMLLVYHTPLDIDGSRKHFLEIRDITASVGMEHDLRAEKDRAQRYLRIAGVMIVAIDTSQRVMLANRRACEILGLPEDRILQRNWFDNFVPERERSRVKEGFDALMQRQLAVAEYFENTVLTHGGEERLIAWHNTVVYDAEGRIIGTLSSGTDITDQRRAEQELVRLNETLEQRVLERTAVAEAQAQTLRALTQELIRAESRERRRIALLLHEHYQQLLAAARMDLSRALQQLPEDGLREVLGRVDSILREAIESSRSLAVDLCPPVLYELGLIPALEWLARRLRERHDLEVHVAADPRSGPENLDLRIFCFEAVRELLFNVVKHAHTRAAEVTLGLEDEHLKIRVADTGIGFEPAAVQPKGGDSLAFGLFVIRERLGSFGGAMEVDTAPGRGTRVTLVVPLRHATA